MNKKIVENPQLHATLVSMSGLIALALIVGGVFVMDEGVLWGVLMATAMFFVGVMAHLFAIVFDPTLGFFESRSVVGFSAIAALFLSLAFGMSGYGWAGLASLTTSVLLFYADLRLWRRGPLVRQVKSPGKEN